MLRDILQGALELFFPDNCLLCRQFLNSRHQKQLCPDCLNRITFNPNPFTYPPSTHAYDDAWFTCIYNEPMQKLLHAFKYTHNQSLVKTFIPLMIQFINRHQLPINNFDVLMPIALHPVKFRERSYNQSELLSQGLSRHFKIPHNKEILIRQKNTTTQTELGAKQRWTNMHDAFRINGPLAIKNKAILLIDDLYTTGATSHHAALALKNAGAARVSVLTLSFAQ